MSRRRRQGAPVVAAGEALPLGMVQPGKKKRRRKKKKQKHRTLPPLTPQHNNNNATTTTTGTVSNSTTTVNNNSSSGSAPFPLSEAEVAVAVRVLRCMAADSAVFHHADVREVRAAVYELPMLKAPVRTLVGRVSDALRDHRFDVAENALLEMRLQGTVPPLGALQRWVRDCDGVSTKGEEGAKLLRVLDCVLRTSSPQLVCEDPAGVAALEERDNVRFFRPFVAPVEPEAAAGEGEEEFSEDEVPFTELMRLKAATRKPPNTHDMVLWRSAFTFKGPGRGKVRRWQVLGVPGAFLLSNVLSASQCEKVVSLTEAVGYMPDCPLTGLSSVLAENCVWMVSEELHDWVNARIAPFLPPDAMGFNRRCRFYRYRENNVYRPHIDGAWPGSGTDANGSYAFDAFGDRYSRLTMLFYFNDVSDEQGGATTFYLPCKQRLGVLNAFPVRPQRGSVLFFPHGSVEGSLLHEGSGLKEGTKYVARTEVLFPKK